MRARDEYYVHQQLDYAKGYKHYPEVDNLDLEHEIRMLKCH
jgi:hypothetical protein